MNLAAINFSDIFKSSFIEKATTSFSILDTLLTLGTAFILGLFIFIVYKKTFTGVLYSQGFGVSLIAMSLITSLIIQAVTSNIILSLGMVGALSIVRFRTAIKEPMDIAFLFWAISSGIVTGAGLIPLAVIGSVIIGVVMILFVNKKTRDNPYLLIINCDNDKTEEQVMKFISSGVSKHMLKSKAVSKSGIEITVEVRLSETTKFINDISGLEGVTNAVLVSYNGQYMQ